MKVRLRSLFVAGPVCLCVLLIAASAAAEPAYSYFRDRNNRVNFIRKDSIAPRTVSLHERSSDPSLTAEAFLERHGHAFGVGNPGRELLPESLGKDALGISHVRYGQFSKGIPVIGSEILVHVSSNGEVLSANGRAASVGQIGTSPSVPQGSALAIALSEWDAEGGMPDPEVLRTDLVIHTPSPNDGKDSSPRLAWLIQLMGRMPMMNMQYFVDAKSGEIIGSLSALRSIYRRIYDCSYGDGRCWTGLSDPSGYVYGRTEGASACGANPYSGTGVYDNDSLYDLAGSINTFFSTRFGRNGMNNEGGTGDEIHNPKDMTDGYTYIEGNAASPSCSNAFYTEGAIYFCKGFVIGGVAAHELAHAVDNFSVGAGTAEQGLRYEYESGAMSEGFADTFGEAYEYWSTGVSDWSVAPEVLGRNMQDPTLSTSRFGPLPDKLHSPNYYCGPNDRDHDYAGVHHNLGVLTHAAYLIAEGGSFNTCTIHGLGREKEERIFYRALTSYLTPTATFNDAYQAILTACGDLYSAADCTEVQRALRATEMDQTSPCNGGTERTPDCSSSISDQCPEDPAKTSPGTCGCGIADTDADGDMIADCTDQCPSDPGKLAPGTCGCGVAETDSNSNSIPDCVENSFTSTRPATPKLKAASRKMTVTMSARSGVSYILRLELPKSAVKKGKKRTYYFESSSSKAVLKNLPRNVSVKISYWYMMNGTEILSRESKRAKAATK